MDKRALFQGDGRGLIASMSYPIKTNAEIQIESPEVAKIIDCTNPAIKVSGDGNHQVIVRFTLQDKSHVTVYFSRLHGSFNSLDLWKSESETGECFTLPDDAYVHITDSKQLVQIIMQNLSKGYDSLKQALATLYTTNGGSLPIKSGVEMADKEKDDSTPRVYTPFGVMVGDAGAYKSFDDESFYEEVLKPSEKEKLKVFKKDFLEDPDKKLPDGVVAGYNFYAWDRPLITSGGRVSLVLDRILSNTWALDKNAIPDFVELLEKLRQKYSTVLGDDDLLKHLEAAQHRARELEATGEVPIGSSRVTSSIEVDARDYYNTYGKPPRGYGRWVFYLGGKPFDRDPNTAFNYEGDYVEAKDAAKIEANKRGVSTIFVGSSRKIQSNADFTLNLRSLLEQYAGLDWDVIDPNGADVEALEKQVFLALRSAGFGLDAADDAMVRVAENPAFVDELMNNLPEDDDDSNFDYPASWGEGHHPFKRSGSPPRFSSRKISSAVKVDVIMEALQEWEDNHYQWQPDKEDDLVDLGLSKSVARRICDQVYDYGIDTGGVGSTRKLLERYISEEGSPRFSSRKIASAVDQQSYDNYIQQLVSQGIPEDQARQMADSLVNNLQESTAQFASEMQQAELEDKNNQFSGLMSNHLRGGKNMNRRFIKSSDDFEEDDIGNEEDLDGGSDVSDDAGLDEGGEDNPLDFGSPNEDGDAELDDGFMDEVNSIEDFGSDTPTLSKEEIVDAVQAISQIVETVLSTEGADSGQNLTSDEVNFTLDEVGDLAAGFDSDAEAGEAPPELNDFDESGFDEDLDEEFPEEIEASLVRVVQAGKPLNSKFSRAYVSPDKFADEAALVCQGFNTSLQVTDYEPKPDQTYETMVLSHVANPSKGTVHVGYMKLGDIKKWVKQSKSHKIAWKIASSKLKRILKSEMKSPREKSAIQALANSYYTKWFIPKDRLSKLVSAKSARVLRRVCSAIHNRYVSGKSTRVIHSDYSGYRNYETWNAALYIENDRDVYNKALSFVKSGGTDYNKFIASAGLTNTTTPDGVKWSNPKIDRSEMSEVLASLTSSYGKGKGMKGIRSNVSTPNTNQVDKDGELVTVQDDTPTGLDLSGETPRDSNIEDDNNTRLTNVDGGDTSEIMDVHNTGDDGSLEADEKAGTEEDVGEYGFDSQEMVGVELPIEEEEATQVLELKHIGSGVYILNRSLRTPGGGRVSFCKGVEASKIVRNNTRPYPVKASVDKQILTLKGGKTALLLRSSSILGVIGVEAPVIKGLKNASYSVFSRRGINLVNSAGDYMTAPRGSQHVIASSVSNKSVRRGTVKRDIFSEVERAYVQFLNNRIHRLLKANAHLNRRLDDAIATNKRQALDNSKRLADLRASSGKEIASSMQSLAAVRNATAQREMEKAMSNTQKAIHEEALNAKARQEKIVANFDRLMRW